MTQTMQGTAALVERARGGDRAAYDQLFALASERALLFIRMRLGHKLREQVDSLDILQQAYLEAHRSFDRFAYRGERSFARWLCRLIENQLRAQADHFGAQKRTPDAAAPAVREAIEKQTGPLTAAGRVEQRERLEAAIAQLEAEEREALLLRHFQQRTQDEIASLLGRSPSATRRLLGRATRRLGALLRSAR